MPPLDPIHGEMGERRILVGRVSGDKEVKILAKDFGQSMKDGRLSGIYFRARPFHSERMSEVEGG